MKAALLIALFISSNTDINLLIAKLQTRYGKMRSLAADFTQVYTDRSGRRLVERGNLVLKRPDKMRWEYNSPEKKLFLVNGSKIYFYVPADKQLTITSIRESEDPRTPFLFLLGRTNLRKDFAKIEASTESPTKAGNVVLELVPKKINSSFERGYAEVDPQTAQVYRITLISPSGARSDFLLTNIQENYSANDALFVFTPPAGTQILR
ncbi:MAG: outer membrane lipoprotein chaperone LolA [Acidobacteriota bacterium]|nr:outer membrane lipoprotein chaperone LolA [Blastocatellia bacterium]MDW8413642.1 outer membrane lipoprotein chaperone LolA [Acidobacteriota bacterium]